MMNDYYMLLADLLVEGNFVQGRTKERYASLFGRSLSFNDVGEHFPILTGKKVHFKSVLHELLWVISGDTNIKYLRDNKVTIWDEWADAEGNLGPVYGHQLRHWTPPNTIGYDQLALSIERLKSDPFSRRNVVSYWNPLALNDMALPPCHTLFQWHVKQDDPKLRLSLTLYMRSCDVFLGLPFNICFYAALIILVSNIVGYEPGNLHIAIGDAHLYENHTEQAATLLERGESIPWITEVTQAGTTNTSYSLTPIFPRLILLNRHDSIDLYRYEDFSLINYNPLPAIKADVAV